MELRAGTDAGAGPPAAGVFRRGGLEAEADQAVRRARRRLLAEQRGDGHWCGELQGDSILESEYILLLAWLGQPRCRAAREAARYLLAAQEPCGGWAPYPGGPLDVSASVKAYFALKLAGWDAESEPLSRARSAIRAAGGADAANSFTRYFLALLGQIDFDLCPAVPPELVLLPLWFPVSLYRMSAWSRTMFAPLSVVWALRPVRPVPESLGVRELFLRPPGRWPPLRPPGAPYSGPISWERLFRTLDRAWKAWERRGAAALRRRALAAARRWMLERMENSDGLGAIFPPIVWSAIALQALEGGAPSPEVRRCLDELERLSICENGTLRLQPCKSPVWDTALAVRALTAAGEPPCGEPLTRARHWLLEREIRRPGDWAAAVRAEPAGWCFEYRNPFYPDVDDTAMVMMALAEQQAAAGGSTDPAASGAAPDLSLAARRRGLQWLLAMQNRDGGWGAFDKDNNAQWLCRVPFADHNAMIDPSTPDIAGRVLECLAQHGRRLGDRAVDRAVRYLRRTQEPDGAWFGRWGVNYVYGTWQALTGLRAAGVDRSDPAIRRGAAWLIERQQPGGGWGETPASYDDPRLRGVGPPTPSQTAWALLGLIAAGLADSTAAQRAVRFLLERQQPDGGWPEPEFTGTGFPRVFYLRYHLYPFYFPLLALSRWRAHGG